MASGTRARPALAQGRGETSANDHLPPYLMTSDPGSFAQTTIVERKPQIIRQVIEDNGYPSEIVTALEELQEEIAQQPVKALPESVVDSARWNGQLASYKGNSWLQLPWYLAEAYFYRRLLEAVGYFEPGPWQYHDPFGRQKRNQAQVAADWLSANWDGLIRAAPEERYIALLHSSLWGNRADLSNDTIRQGVPGGLAARSEKHNILIDDTRQVADLLASGVSRVDFVNDNVGFELLFDLALADFFLEQGWAHRVVLHLKDQPFFVSDAMTQDVEHMVSLIRSEPLGQRLERRLDSGDLGLEGDPFWTTGLMFHQMPDHLTGELALSDLVILKGDVNYRRLLADRHWPYDTAIESITSYFPAPLLVLRTLKGEILAGLQPGEAESLAAQDPAWLINGKLGLIQFVDKS